MNISTNNLTPNKKKFAKKKKIFIWFRFQKKKKSQKKYSFKQEVLIMKVILRPHDVYALIVKEEGN